MVIRFKLIPICLLCVSINCVDLQASKVKDFMQKHKLYTDTKLKYLEKGKVLSNADVKNLDKLQSLNLQVSGLHQKTCSIPLSKLSQYENYHQFMDFVEESSYQQKTFRMVLGHTLLPAKFILYVEIPRITQPGVYPFVLHKGIFDGLKGLITIFAEQNKCYFHLSADWKGPDTGYPALVVETFVQALAKKGLEKLFHLSFHRF
jgi:hypothetical protein